MILKDVTTKACLDGPLLPGDVEGVHAGEEGGPAGCADLLYVVLSQSDALSGQPAQVPRHVHHQLVVPPNVPPAEVVSQHDHDVGSVLCLLHLLLAQHGGDGDHQEGDSWGRCAHGSHSGRDTESHVRDWPDQVTVTAHCSQGLLAALYCYTLTHVVRHVTNKEAVEKKTK